MVAIACSLAIAAGFTRPPRALADYVYCPPAGGPCVVVVTTPSGPGSGGGGSGDGGAGGCTYQGVAIPCHNKYGWFDGVKCYWDAAQNWKQPLPPGATGWYRKSCVGPGGVVTGGTVVPLSGPPPRVASPAEAAARAINLLGLTGPDIGIVPKPGSLGGLVGLPVWLWTRVTPTTWGPNSATASLPGVSVTARANASKIVWSMGDGHSITCTNPGMAYADVYGKQPSPRCGYTYSTPGRYIVTGTTYWHVTWAGGGQTGALDVQRSSSAQIVIGELQVLVQ